MKKENCETLENPMYHDTWILLKKYRDVVWSLELSVQRVRRQFQIEYGSSIEEFLESIYLAGVDFADSGIEEHAQSIERSHKMLKLVESSVELLRNKHKHGEDYYWLLYYSFLSPQQYRSAEEIIEQLKPHIRDISYRTYYRKRKEAKPYGTDNIGGYGCGPTSMSIVVSSLTNDIVDPVEMSQWAYENGYWCSGSGSYHSLIPGAAKAWGLPVEGCTASEGQRIVDALSSGKLVVAIMSKGHFTSSGHFIVLRGVQNGKILVADPASYTRSEQEWDLSIILNEASKGAGAGGPFWIIG